MSVRRIPRSAFSPQRASIARIVLGFFITIMLAAVYALPLKAQQITTQAPPTQGTQNQTHPALPQAPGYPDAILLLDPLRADSPVLESDTQAFHAGVFTLDGHVVITSGMRRVEADHIVYDSNSGEIAATGNLLLTGGPNAEVLHASRGNFNLKTATGRFYDVTGSVGLTADATARPTRARASTFQSDPVPSSGPGAGTARENVYLNDNPFLFTARMVVKTGPRDYDLYDGTVTSCQLPHPDWLFSGGHFQLTQDKLTAHNSTFHLLNVPILFLPYVTHPADSKERQSGVLIPTFGQYDKSGSKGVDLGEQVYLVLGRSADLVLGAEYYSSIGFGQNAAFRYKGAGFNFITARYTGVLDRRTGAANQGGEDALAAGRFDLSPETRAAANIEYLSSYIYREAFSTSFNQAVNSDIVSTAYLTHAHNGYEFAGLADRYQGIKLIAQGTTPQQQVRLFHAPSLLADSTDHPLAHTPLLFSFSTEFSALKRTQPNFATGGLVERLDLRPRLDLPLHLGGWNLLPAISARETAYTRSRFPAVQGQTPVEDLSALSRSSFDFTLGIRPPVLTRTFTPTRFKGFFGEQVRHTIEPELDYRLTKGIDNFNRILRFDETDVASDTNEAEYGVTQRLFRRRAGGKACTNPVNGGLDPEETVDAEANSEDLNQSQPGDCRKEELISWRLSQKYFFDQNFGNAIVNGRRNIFETTLNFSGIAFLTEARAISPLVSRLRVKSSASTDVEWDFDLDTGARKFTSSNVFIDYHRGPAFTALSYARLDAPGRFYTEGVSATAATGVTNAISDFNQIRYLAGYGNPAKAGLSVAANIGLDLKSLYGATSTVTAPSGVTTSTTVYPALFQYAALQTSYNWNCCGLSVEYRKFELGSVRNENSYRFNFTLANIGSAGNLRKAERLF